MSSVGGVQAIVSLVEGTAWSTILLKQSVLLPGIDDVVDVLQLSSDLVVVL